MDDDSITIPDYGLKCKACGYFLAGLPRHICPECGRAFSLEEFIPQGEFPVVYMEGKPVQAERNVRDLMTRYHIPFMEKNSLTDSQMLAVGPKTHAPGQLCVPRESYFDVLDLLRHIRLNIELPPPPDNSAADLEWTCPACSESNPGTFELCWNCEGERA